MGANIGRLSLGLTCHIFRFCPIITACFESKLTGSRLAEKVSNCSIQSKDNTDDYAKRNDQGNGALIE
jgi:hypothetical protein